ncbi:MULTISPECIES: amino acid ABC transporter permease [Brenneria]|uniref:Amino acid ABC transporter permease n=1 Tax=Brenneria nigrifluens DSM 30175 = ATCC 13028 TaxID=1121120 RepID=A0A2U1UVH9_9GAMM|nr:MULTISPECIES: amino acid ABC transporter permease [Brenneria]EHD20226.1 polar amino acid ABC transporter, inner membrane subunit [Brenneria sp. EniD312]PWC25685.1 amino acid ABC transporter permease [Brenneria nigrifluens DSM 30175 = ATCC 13028]QCR03450.1 amino acid ABC transporter permease [Brenneria nigrifluens DSM 30175 = ATCC 13028]
MFSLDFFLNNIPFILSALPKTLYITFFSTLFASTFGMLLTYFRIKKTPVLHIVAEIIISFGRSVPALVMLYFVYYVYPYLIAALLNKPINSIAANKLSADTAAIVSFTLIFSAYFSEVFRSAYQAVDKGQREAGWSVGLSGFTCFRRILLPQSAISALPNYTSVVIDLIKDSALVYTITVVDVMAKANIAAARGFHFVEAYLIVLLIYIALCFAFAKALRIVEARLNKKWGDASAADSSFKKVALSHRS